MAAPASSGTTTTVARGCYVYGIVPESAELPDDMTGVGDPAGTVRVIRHGRVAALVSDLETDRPLGTPQDLAAHQRLLDATSARMPVLPLRFGAVMTNDQAVAEELLAPQEDEFADALDELSTYAEYVVKGRYVQDIVLREVLAENPQAARLRDEIVAAGDPDATYNLRIQLGELINNAVTEKRVADTRAFGAAVAPHVARSVVRDPTSEEDAVHMALLVDREQQPHLEDAVGQMVDAWNGRVTVRLLGPMAPYDFVASRAPGT